MTPHPRPAAWLRAVLILIAVAAVAVPALVVTTAPPSAVARARRIVPPARVEPQAVVPEVEPVELVDLTPDEARTYNADVPFVRGHIPAARAFHLRDAAGDMERATDCLAAAVLYEAGDDPAGQRAVAQVVLNRLRHPAFPKTLCGVVFEGQERRTGCQFTFNCDGALTRWSPPPAMWTRARAAAAAALAGQVDRKVGYATHYHTDWVVPYWQSSLDKIARVGDHLFFRWTGWWGTPAAFGRQVTATEPVIAKLAAFSDAHRMAGAAEQAEQAQIAGVTAALLAGGDVAPPTAGATDPDSFLAALPAGVSPDTYPQLAAATCGGRARCKYLGWTDAKAVPTTGQPDAAQTAAMSFSYLRDRAAGLERTLWNCIQFPRTRPGGCMKRQPLTLPSPTASVASILKGPPELTGVRRPAPSSTPIPSSSR